jgi:heme/copper-type cytochrome/quinol oxidase subunit 2
MARAFSIAVWCGLLLLAGVQSLSACPVCFGEKNDQMAAGISSAIWVMLGITLFMMALVGVFFINLQQRLKHQQETAPETSIVSGEGTLHIQHEQGV